MKVIFEDHVNIQVVCAHCKNNDTEPSLEINFKDKKIYYVCSKCRKENEIDLNVTNPYLPKPKRL